LADVICTVTAVISANFLAFFVSEMKNEMVTWIM